MLKKIGSGFIDFSEIVFADIYNDNDGTLSTYELDDNELYRCELIYNDGHWTDRDHGPVTLGKTAKNIVSQDLSKNKREARGLKYFSDIAEEFDKVVEDVPFLKQLGYTVPISNEGYGYIAKAYLNMSMIERAEIDFTNLHVVITFKNGWIKDILLPGVKEGTMNLTDVTNMVADLLK